MGNPKQHMPRLHRDLGVLAQTLKIRTVPHILHSTTPERPQRVLFDWSCNCRSFLSELVLKKQLVLSLQKASGIEPQTYCSRKPLNAPGFSLPLAEPLAITTGRWSTAHDSACLQTNGPHGTFSRASRQIIVLRAEIEFWGNGSMPWAPSIT